MDQNVVTISILHDVEVDKKCYGFDAWNAWGANQRDQFSTLKSISY